MDLVRKAAVKPCKTSQVVSSQQSHVEGRSYGRLVPPAFFLFDDAEETLLRFCFLYSLVALLSSCRGLGSAAAMAAPIMKSPT